MEGVLFDGCVGNTHVTQIVTVHKGAVFDLLHEIAFKFFQIRAVGKRCTFQPLNVFGVQFDHGDAVAEPPTPDLLQFGADHFG